ncbi:recombinase family protein [Rhizobium sp. AAP116]|uniref:recombinase family protein n=1 Tax=Rhizobium sp. AAP116 TaxID=1523429 RepID=UPI0006B8CD98|nr:recombinase family protein [Rhizobium sp. AAP116]
MINSARPIAYSYVRMSSKQQLRGDSRRRQLELSEAYAKAHNLILDASLQDIGVSAWAGDNLKSGALGKFLAMVKTGEVQAGSYLLVESLDRLSRQQVRFAIPPFIELINAGITVVTLADGQAYSQTSVDDNFTQLMMSLAIMSRAHEESTQKSKRVKAAHAKQRENASRGIGRFSGRMFSWIDTVETAPGHFEYRLNEHAETVRRVFDLADSGLGQVAIAAQLNSTQTRTFRGSGLWQQGYVSALIRNEAVIGTYQPTEMIDGKRVPFGQPLLGYLPAAVPEDLFWRVQTNRRRRPISNGRKGKKMSNMLGELLRCTHCGARLRMRNGGYKGKPQRYVCCDNSYRGGGCASKGNFRYDLLETAVLDNVPEFHLDAQLLRRSPLSRVQELNALIGEAQTRMQQHKTKIRNLIDIAEMSDVPAVRQDILRELTKRKSEEQELQDRIHELNEEIGEISSGEQDASEVALRLAIERRSWGHADDLEIYESRSRLSQALQRTIDFIDCDFETRTATVIIAGGLRAYKFAQNGELVDKVDLEPLIGRSIAPHRWYEKTAKGKPNRKKSTLVYGGSLRAEHFARVPSSNGSDPEDFRERAALIAKITKQAREKNKPVSKA